MISALTPNEHGPDHLPPSPKPQIGASSPDPKLFWRAIHLPIGRAAFETLRAAICPAI